MKKLLTLSALALAATIIAAPGADVKATYKKDCAKCHGDDGKGDTRMGKKLGARDYTDSKVQAELKDEKMFKVIREGLKEDGKTKMKPTKDLTDQEIKDLIAYMRAFKGK